MNKTVILLTTLLSTQCFAKGPYAGLSLGGSFLSTKRSDKISGAQQEILIHEDEKIKKDSVIGSLFVGYGFPLSSCFTLGIEPYFQMGSSKNVTNKITDFGSFDVTTKRTWGVGLDFRLGYAMGGGMTLSGILGVKTDKFQYQIQELDTNKSAVTIKKMTPALNIGLGLDTSISSGKIGLDVKYSLYKKKTFSGLDEDLHEAEIKARPRDLTVMLRYSYYFK